MHTFVVAVPPVAALLEVPWPLDRMIESQRRRINAITELVCATRDGVTMIPFELSGSTARNAADTRLSAETHAARALMLSPQIGAALAHRAPRTTGRSVDEHRRQASLDALGVIGSLRDARVDRIVETARNLFGVSAAAVTFLDHDRRWVKSAVGTLFDDRARCGSLCDVAIARSRALVVHDVLDHPDLADTAHLRGPENFRFYAGYPIEAPDGHRVGALCIMDSSPRAFDERDGALLRDLALQVQSVIWSRAAA